MAARPLTLQVENRVAVRSREVPKLLHAVRSCKEKLPVLNVTICVQLRFQRFGRKKQPFYRLVAIDSRVRRDGRPLEVRSFCFLSSLRMQRLVDSQLYKKCSVCWVLWQTCPAASVALAAN